MPNTLSLVVLPAGCLLVYAVYQLLKNRNRRLPPGPTGYPLIGNLLDLPAEREWETYTEWSKRYGMCRVE